MQTSNNVIDSLPNSVCRPQMSRLEVDSLEQSYIRKFELIPPGKPPVPLPPTTSPPSPPPPSPTPPPPPKKYHLQISAPMKCNAKQTDEENTHITSRWMIISSMYWKILVGLQLVLSVTDIVDESNSILMYYQRIFLIFLFSAAILIIISMYIHTLHSKCPGSASHQKMVNEDFNSAAANTLIDEERLSFGSLHGTLKRAYIKRQTVPFTNFHMRLAAVVFGIASLICFGFEIAVHTTGGEECVDDLVYTLPIVLVIFCFFQIHFLFVNSQVSVGCFRGPSMFCFAHLMATNITLWMKTIGFQSVTNWVIYLNGLHESNKTTEHLHHEKIAVHMTTVSGLWWTTLLPSEFERIAILTNCIHNASLGQMWIQATPFLIPFLLQFCIVSASVFYVSWRGKQNSVPLVSSRNKNNSINNAEVTYCHMENRGVFIGLLLVVGGVVVLVMYLILRGQPQFLHDSIWVINGTLCLMLAISIMSTLTGFLKIQGIPYAHLLSPVSPLDDHLVSITTIGALLYSILGLIVATSHIDTNTHLLIMSHSGLLLIQVVLQNIYMSETWRRVQSRSGNQIVQILLFANASLWLLDTFMTASGDSQVLQESFFGPLLWGILSLTCTPLIALYRFHSSIQLYELWRRSYT